MDASRRTVLLIAHAGRRESGRLVAQLIERLRGADFDVRMLRSDATDCAADVDCIERLDDAEAVARDAEMVLVLGGDGTFLRAAELARPAGAPMLGINLGHVGFLAESEPQALAETVDAIVDKAYTVEERVTVDAQIIVDGEVRERAWALNEASLERTNRARMLDLAVAVDDRPLLRFGCDGVLCSTPTGSTAYAFSAGGPIVWPDVDALLIVPNAAHALFSRPIMVAPSSRVDIDLQGGDHAAMLSCDGRRSVDVPPGARVRVTRGEQPVRIARMPYWSFADRLVTKFRLPVRSLREAALDDGEPDPGF